jgi:TonB family protein
MKAWVEFMKPAFWRDLKIVTVGHFVALGLLCIPFGCQSIFGKKHEVTAVTFMVQVPAGSEDVPPEPDVPDVAPPPAPAPAPEPEAAAPEPPAPKPPKAEPAPAIKLEDKTKPKKPDKAPAPAGVGKKSDTQKKSDVEVSQNKVKRRHGMGGRSASSPLSEAQIRRLLLQGAVEGDRTIIPGEEDRNLALVQRALYSAWVQPSKDDAGESVAEAEIRLDVTGKVTGYRITKSSGKAMLDASVAEALKDVKRVTGLSGTFLKQHPEVTVAFRVE